VNIWLWGATLLVAGLVPLAVVAAHRRHGGAVVALVAAGNTAALALLLLAQGTDSPTFASLALILAVTSFVGSVAFLEFLERLR
jgi:multisubunit Na+/H+ antiporter MnhF subunit